MHEQPPQNWKTGKKNIILVPGYTATWHYFKNLGNFLNKNGFKIHTVSEIEPNIHKISYGVEKIKNYILKNNLKNIVILAHSKGGIISRYLLKENEVKDKIKLVVNISAPNKGSILGLYSLHYAHELTPWSKTIKHINSQNEGLKKIINIYGILDNFIIPNSSLHLDGAQNIKINIARHVQIVKSPKIWNIILDKIKND